MKTQFLFPGIFFLFFMLTISCKNDPVQVYPANPHYFSYKGHPIVLITSDHHYGAIIDQDFDFAEYLKFLSDNEMNLTRIYPGGMFEPTDKYLKGNPLGPRPGRQLLPWAISNRPALILPSQNRASLPLNMILIHWNPAYFDPVESFCRTGPKI